ncbi:MAG: bacillithiol biosynthesis cysteine-adding enzyme BshC [Bacteroidota bacterium]|nr:bacillithiol biosynthesis cysteine-adding enzyme BshC [Bacteroidota bacterium]
MKFIPFDTLQAFDSDITRLYVDYLSHFEKVQQFYSLDFHDRRSWKKAIAEIASRRVDRSTLVRVLTEQNKEIHCGIKTLANIDLLGNENTVAIVTGQQLGLFTGPLYTLYKTITAIRLAEKLTAEYPEFNFVPVFWVEGEDHDFEEVNHTFIISSTNQIAKIEYLPEGKLPERNLGAVGNIIFDQFIDLTLAALEGNLQETEFKPGLVSEMKAHYKSGTTFSKAFLGLMNRYVEDSGIVFLNPMHPEFKQLLKPVFQKEISSITKISRRVIDKSAELEEHYHAQIKSKPLNLFMFHKEGRFHIEPRENDFSLKGTRRFISKEEINTLVEQSPELFSPNVVLRPICQDTLLPTLAYVAGPSEIAYFAQLKPVYDFFDLPMPVIYPRASATILEEKTKNVLEKYQIEIEQIFSGLEPVLMRVSEQGSDVKVDELFRSISKTVHDTIQEARFGIQQIDATLAGSVDSTLAKIDSYLNVLKDKTLKAQLQRQEVSVRQVQRAALVLRPNDNFQERVLSVTYFLNKYGPDFVKWLSGELAIDRFQHQIIEL